MTLTPENRPAPYPHDPAPARDSPPPLQHSPRSIPPDIRGEIASILVSEIIDGVTFPSEFPEVHAAVWPFLSGYTSISAIRKNGIAKRLATKSPEIVRYAPFLSSKFSSLLEDLQNDYQDLDGELAIFSWFDQPSAGFAYRSGEPPGFTGR